MSTSARIPRGDHLIETRAGLFCRDAAVINVRIGASPTVAPGRLRAYRRQVGGRAVSARYPRFAGASRPVAGQPDHRTAGKTAFPGLFSRIVDHQVHRDERPAG